MKIIVEFEKYCKKRNKSEEERKLLIVFVFCFEKEGKKEERETLPIILKGRKSHRFD